MAEASNTIDREEYLKAYQEHARTLKTWFVAYGVGVLILLITRDRPWNALINSGYATIVGSLSLVGVSAQVFIAICNKVANWFCYFGEFRTNFKSKRPYKISRWFEGQFWIDCLFDLITLGAFIWATICLFRALVK